MFKKLSMLVFAAIIGSGQLFATPVTYELSSFTGDPAKATFSIEANLDGSITFGVTLDEPTDGISVFGDINALYLDLNESIIAPLSSSLGEFSGSELSGVTVSTNGVDKVGSNANNLNPEGDFDFGALFSNPGGGTMLTQAFFTYQNTAGFTLSDFTADRIGLRVTSLGLSGNGSSKLLTTTNDVPEPSTVFMLAMGIMVAFLGLKKTKRAGL